MTFHTRSVTELGRLFIDLSDSLSQQGVAGALQVVRTAFDLDAALLTIECRNRSKAPQSELSLACDTTLTQASFAGATGVSGSAAQIRDHHMAMVSLQAPDGANRYVLRLYRRDTRPAFDGDETGMAEMLLAQLGRGLETTARRVNHDVERVLYSDLLDRLQVGVIVLDGSGRLLSVSARAQSMLKRRDGLQVVNGRLCTLNASEDKRFQALVRAALADQLGEAEAAGQGLSLTKPSSMRKMGVIVRSIPGGAGEGQPAVSIYVRDADTSPDVEATLMRQIFDLTPAEAAVARRLTDGLSLEDTAVALDISRNTARAHLRSIFSKSGIKRQTELVRLVLNSAVVL